MPAKKKAAKKPPAKKAASKPTASSLIPDQLAPLVIRLRRENVILDADTKSAKELGFHTINKK